MSQNLGCCLWLCRLSLLAHGKEFYFWALTILRKEKRAQMVCCVNSGKQGLLFGMVL